MPYHQYDSVRLRHVSRAGAGIVSISGYFKLWGFEKVYLRA
jgi:hypothetical protein